ncbi:ankyrin repeat-containing protein [Fusarium mundagurra]|uniref:Ankyrin repeat-containing protein n=1 Tax=Fusarium mundagurra TaxID=1567541 RepID=A0A8H5YK76_9HYPO|nr:ankyrin repeat-containing protein [Fusarium mundagurra]
MADPLSVAGLALAVVSLGLQVTGGITDYFDSLKSRDQDIASVMQQNDTLRKTLQIIESSISRFQNDHRTETEALRQFLDSSNEELRALESMVATLITNDQGTTGRRNTARNKGKKLLYPFHRPKLEQMATKLHHINATLQLGLQSLGFSVSYLGSEKLTALHATSQTISSDLLVVQSEVSAMSTPIQGMQSAISQFGTRFDDLENLLKQVLVQGSTMNGTPQDITPALVTGRLLRKPGVLREICDAVVTPKPHRSKERLSVPHENVVMAKAAVSSYTGGRFACLCRHRRHVQRWNAALGSLALSHETTAERHLPACPAAQTISEPDRSKKVALTYTGLRYLLNSAIQLSFTIGSGAGGLSFSPNFTYYPIVDSKSASTFRMMSLLTSSRNVIWNFCKNCSLLEDRAWEEELLPAVVSSILRLFQTKQASPRAVNECNESLVYRVAQCIKYCYNVVNLPQRQAETSQARPLLDLLEYLFNNKALTNDYNTRGDTPLSTMFGLYSYGSVAHPVPTAAADLILQSNTDGAAVSEFVTSLTLGWKLANVAGQVIWAPSAEVQLHFLSCSTRIADGLSIYPLKSAPSVMLTKSFHSAYGCGPLGWAILSHNLEEVKLLIANHPSTLGEINEFGHTPLHLAADKPSILRVLVDVADTALLNWTHYGGSSALDFAVSLSGTSCRGLNKRMCKRCRSDIEQLGLRSKHVLDSNTFKVTQLLQKRGVCVPEALAMRENGIRSYPWSVYGQLESPDDADILLRLGFRDVESWCDSDDLERWYVPGRQSLSYLRWLANHGGICCQLPFPTAKDIFGSACIFSAIGTEIRDSWTSSCFRYGQSNESDGGNSLPALPTMDPAEEWYHEVHSAVFEARTVDSCSCQCSPGGCNMLTFILRELINERDYKYKPRRYSQNHAMTGAEDSGSSTMNSTDPSEGSFLEENPLLKLIDKYIIYLSHFSCHFRRWHHYATIRFITFAALGIGHSCCRRDDVNRVFEDDLEDNQGYKMALLEDLINEFEKTITSLLEDPDIETHRLMDFWEQTWVGRMSDVLDHLEGSALTEDEKRAAEEIGVVWDKVGPEPPEPDPKEKGNPYQRNMIEYWLYELRKIEEECQ